MCCTPAGLCHFLSVYFTAYPPRDYREKKRREQWQEPPLPLTHTRVHARTRARTRTRSLSPDLDKKKWNLLANVYPLTRGEQVEQGGAAMEEQAAAYFTASRG